MVRTLSVVEGRSSPAADRVIKKYLSDEIMREQFVKSGEWKLTNSKIEKSLEVFNKYQTGSNRKNNTQYSGKCYISRSALNF